MIRLCPPTLYACLRILPWRRACADSLRTAPGTLWSQFRFWRWLHSGTCPHRYWAVKDGWRIVAFTGLVNGEEISLVVDPARRGKGIGNKAVYLVLEQATRTPWGEVYAHNRARKFWQREVKARRGWWRRVQTARQGQTVDAYRFTLPRRAA